MASPLQSPTGTVTVSLASCLSFPASCRNLVRIENLTTGVNPCYLLLNDSSTAPLVSASVYDFVLRQGESLTFGRDFLMLFPLATLGVFTALGAPHVRGI